MIKWRQREVKVDFISPELRSLSKNSRERSGNHFRKEKYADHIIESRGTEGKIGYTAFPKGVAGEAI